LVKATFRLFLWVFLFSYCSVGVSLYDSISGSTSFKGDSKMLTVPTQYVHLWTDQFAPVTDLVVSLCDRKSDKAFDNRRIPDPDVVLQRFPRTVDGETAARDFADRVASERAIKLKIDVE
jgi:hypothetical protein